MARYAITLGLLFGATVLHWVIVASQSEAAQESSAPIALNVPSRIVGFRQAGIDVPADANLRQALETNSILMRDYRAPNGVPVELAIVYAETTRRSLHFPEVCLTGGGWEVTGQFPVTVGAAFVAKGVTLTRGSERRAVLYWFKTGRHLTGNYFLNSFYWARDKVLLRAPSSMLVRLTTPIGPQGEDAAFDTLGDFAGALAPILVETIR